MIEDPQLPSVIAALDDAVLLRRGAEVLGITDTSPLDHLVATTWRRVLLLLPELAAIPADQAQPQVRALADLRGTIEVAQSAGLRLELDAFEDALSRLEQARLAPQIDGAITAFALLDGRADGAVLAGKLRGELAAAYVKPADRLAFLGGIIAIARELLWTMPEVIEALDTVIADVDDEEFITLVPHLRLALMPLDPRDIDRLSSMVAQRLGISEDRLQAQVPISEAEAMANMRLDQAMAQKLAAEGLL